MNECIYCGKEIDGFGKLCEHIKMFHTKEWRAEMTILMLKQLEEIRDFANAMIEYTKQHKESGD